jgi:hypothetical protein
MCVVLAAAAPLIPWATTALAVGSSFAGIRAANAQAASANSANYTETIYQQLQSQFDATQANDEARSVIIERQQEALRRRGMIMAAGGDTSFNSTTDRLLATTDLASDMDQATALQNARNVGVNRTLETSARVDNYNRGRLKGVNPFLGALQIGTAGAGGYASGLSLRG